MFKKFLNCRASLRRKAYDNALIGITVMRSLSVVLAIEFAVFYIDEALKSRVKYAWMRVLIISVLSLMSSPIIFIIWLLSKIPMLAAFVLMMLLWFDPIDEVCSVETHASLPEAGAETVGVRVEEPSMNWST